MAKPSVEQKQLEDQKEAPAYTAGGEDLISKDFFEDRLLELQAARRNVAGVNIETIWRNADRAYIPHTARTSGTKAYVEDDTLGWRSRQVTLGSENWQEDSIPPNPYIKIQTALGVLIDRNPEGVFNPGAPRYEANTLLMENLYKRSWDIAKSKQQLKIFIFNLAKYGWAPARTYPLVIKRKTRDILEYNPSDLSKNKYKEEETVYFDDIFRETLNPWHTWIDDGAKPNNGNSVNDWVYFKDFDWKEFHEQFGNLENAKFVILNRQPGSSAAVGGSQSSGVGSNTNEAVPQILQDDNVVRVWFYENLSNDMFYIQSDIQNGGVVLVNEPIPFSPKNKKLSLWQTYWTIRSDNTPYGIGLYEAMRNDAKLLTKVRNMTTDQLLLSIYWMGFHSGGNQLDGDGDIIITPGKIKQLIEPEKLKWMQVPPPGKEAAEFINFLEEKIDEDTGITKTIQGEVTGKTAFEVAQSREFALKRLRVPLENITDALEQEAYITISLIEEVYSVPKVERLGKKSLINNYREEILANPELFEVRDGDLFIKEYRQVQLGLEENEEGKFEASENLKFFTLLPEMLRWEGVINVMPQSVLFESEILTRQMKLELANQLIPMFQGPPEIFMKPAKQMLKLYKEDPKDWMPDAWLGLGSQGIQPIGAEQGIEGVVGPQGASPEGQTPDQFIVNQPGAEQPAGVV